jgi:hypothetical protein
MPVLVCFKPSRLGWELLHVLCFQARLAPCPLGVEYGRPFVVIAQHHQHLAFLHVPTAAAAVCCPPPLPQVFTIEPMVNAGTWRDLLWPDGWTAVTRDGGRSAQFEHQLVVTATGADVLTARLPDSPPLWWEQEAAS